MRPSPEGFLLLVIHALRTIRRFAPLWLVLACGGSPPVAQDPPPVELAVVEPGDVFSKELAWGDLEFLAALGPRPPGSDAAVGARRHLRDRLEGWGIEVRDVTTDLEVETGEKMVLEHLVATLPGRSADRFVLVAPYDSGVYTDFAFRGVNDGASGAALLVEIARVLAGRDLPYTVDLVWLAGEGRLGTALGPDSDLRWLGSVSLADQWNSEGRLEGVRLLVSFNRVCDADLRIARDLGSHRAHREEFWRSARRLGRSAAFPMDAPYESFDASHTAFERFGLRRVVAIEDTAFGGAEPPGLYAGEGDSIEHCSAASLETVGVVALEALETIGKRLAKIDRFSRMPTAEPEVDPLAPATEARTESPEAGTPAEDPLEPPPAEPRSVEQPDASAAR